MTSKISIFVLLIAVAIAAATEAKTLDEQQQELRASHNDVFNNYHQVVEKLYRKQKGIANELAKSGDATTAEVLKTLSQISIVTESIRLFTRQKSFDTADRITSKKIKDKVRGENEILKNELVIKRAEVRGLADGIRFTQSSLNWFHKLVTYYVVERKDASVNVDALREIVLNTYQRIQATQSALFRAYREQQRMLSKWVKTLGVSSSLVANEHLVSKIDKELDDESGCLSCSKLYPADPELLDTSPMVIEYEISQFIENGLDKSLSDSFEICPRVHEFSDQEQNSVTRGEFEALMSSALLQEGLL